MSSRAVLHVINADQRRGAENVAGVVHDGFRSRGVTSTLVALAPSAFDHRDDVDIVLTRHRRKSFPLQVVRLHRMIRDAAPEALLAHGFVPALVSVLATLPLRRRPRIVWHRILRLPRDPSDPRYLVHRFVARRVDAVICITAYLCEETCLLGFNGTPSLIPNHRPAAPQGAPRAEPRTAAQRSPFVLFAGRLVPQKRPDRFLDVVEDLVRRGADGSFVIAGTGPMEPLLRRRIADSPSLRDRVALIGHSDDIARLLRDAACLVLTSENESSPGIAVEAAMAGCPVAAYDVDGVREILDGGRGTVVPNGNAPALADAIERYLMTGVDIDARAASADAASATFSSEAVLDQYLTILGRTRGLPEDDTQSPASRRAGACSRVRPSLMLVIPNFGVGGLERGTVSIARAAHSLGVDVVVATLTRPRIDRSLTQLPALEELGIPVVDVGLSAASTYRNPLRVWRAARRLTALGRDVGADVISSAILDADLPSRAAARRLGIRQCTHLVNTTYSTAAQQTGTSRRIAFATARALERFTSRWTQQYIALTDSVAEYARSELRIPSRKVLVIGRGVNTLMFAPSQRSHDHPRSVVSLGRLVPQKDHACAIRAFGLASLLPHMSLAIYGEGPLHAELSALTTHERIQLRDPVTDVAAVLRHADVYLSCARWEGQSNALLEAMASGCLLVLTDIDVFREVAGGAAWYFPPGDTRALAEVLLEVTRTDPRELARRRQMARDRAEQLYDERELAAAAVAAMLRGVIEQSAAA